MPGATGNGKPGSCHQSSGWAALPAASPAPRPTAATARVVGCSPQTAASGTASGSLPTGRHASG